MVVVWSLVCQRRKKQYLYRAILIEKPEFSTILLTEIGRRLALAGGDVQAQALPTEDGDIALSAR